MPPPARIQQRPALTGDVLYGVAGALAMLTVVTAVLAAVTSRTTNPHAQADRSPKPC